jgi:adenine-specific DNA-methyltransferase
MHKLQKLELNWIGKNDITQLEARVLLENKEFSYGNENTENMIIHADNLLALKALEQDYMGQVKCVYIDPPYNTGSAFENYDDGIEHSVWLNLMNARLNILYKLISSDGSIWISIDDNEVHYLKVLLDEIFGRSNFIACLPTIMNLKGNQDQFGFAGSHEYTLVYVKDKSLSSFNAFNVDEEEILSSWNTDDIGLYKKGANLKATGINAPREKRPNLFYPMFIDIDTNTVYVTDDDIKVKDTDIEIFPITNDEEMSWRWSKKKVANEPHNIIVTGSSIYKKQRPELGDIPTKKPKSTFYRPEYSSGNGTSQIKKIFGRKAFDYPKPEELIGDFLHIASNEGDLILDSFLGSGTSAAVAHKMNRRYIGIELGEHAKDLVLPRLQQVVDGIDKGGVSRTIDWQGGGGFKFYTLAPSLLRKDKFDNWIIEPSYNADLLASALAKQEAFTYHPDSELFWKQGYSTENDFIFTTTQFITVELIDRIHDEMGEDESLLVCAKTFQDACLSRYDNITLKKIPKALLGKCEFAKDDYSLNITETEKVEADDEY